MCGIGRFLLPRTEQPIRTRYLGNVTGYGLIRDQYFGRFLFPWQYKGPTFRLSSHHLLVFSTTRAALVLNSVQLPVYQKLDDRHLLPQPPRTKQHSTAFL
eukprot:sb/3478675/